MIGAARVPQTLELIRGDVFRVSFRITNPARDVLHLTGHNVRAEFWTRASGSQPQTERLERPGLLNAVSGVVTLELTGAETLAISDRKLLLAFVHIEPGGAEITLCRADVDVRDRGAS